MSLREEIAEHLNRTWGKTPGFTPTKSPLSSYSQLYQDHYLGMADEVIRLMRWTRREVDRIASYHLGPPGDTVCGDSVACCVEHVRANISAEPLTLPPEGWEP